MAVTAAIKFREWRSKCLIAVSETSGAVTADAWDDAAGGANEGSCSSGADGAGTAGGAALMAAKRETCF